MRQKYATVAPEAAAKRSWVVIDAEWTVAFESTSLVLRLAMVHYHGFASLAVGNDLPVVIDFGPGSSDSPADSGFTQQGRIRLNERAKIHATVFGTAESYDDGTLRVNPIALYDRKGLA